VVKEELVGIWKAVELFVRQDHGAIDRRWNEQVDGVIRAFANVSGVKAVKDEAPYTEGIPVAKLIVDPAVAGKSAADIASALLEGEPAIKVNQQKDWVSVNPQFLEPGEDAAIVERLRAILGVRELAAAR
jgi:L-seryl-tRNA(Ser) seleniumtransferase